MANREKLEKYLRERTNDAAIKVAERSGDFNSPYGLYTTHYDKSKATVGEEKNAHLLLALLLESAEPSSIQYTLYSEKKDHIRDIVKSIRGEMQQAEQVEKILEKIYYLLRDT